MGNAKIYYFCAIVTLISSFFGHQGLSFFTKNVIHKNTVFLDWFGPWFGGGSLPYTFFQYFLGGRSRVVRSRFGRGSVWSAPRVAKTKGF